MSSDHGGERSRPGAPVAAIDCGTNSTRLLVTDGGRTVERLMRITRLGRGVDATGRLDPAAVESTCAVLTEYRQVMDRLGVSRVRIAATSAARDAANRADFFGPATEIIGVEPELLSGSEEAELSFAGATADLDPSGGPYLVVDIGGGSTELAYGTSSFDCGASTDMGCVRFTEKYLHGDPPGPEELLSCLSVAEAHIDEIARQYPAMFDARQLVGLAGTVSTAAAVEQGLASYDRDRIHHFRLTRAAIEDVFRTLATESRADRIHNPGLEPERADVIVGGMCILVKVMRYFRFDDCLVSEADILDGMAASIS